MKKLVLQEVNIQDVVNKVVERVENGEAYTTSSRNIGNLVDGHGQIYTLSIRVTCDIDEVDDLPELTVEQIQDGRCIIRAPEGYLPTARGNEGGE